MNLHCKEAFRGKVVNKRLTFNTGMDDFPRYVLEYLIDNCCIEETFEEDFAQVKRRLRENFVHGAERIRHYIRENREHTLIPSLEVRLVETVSSTAAIIMLLTRMDRVAICSLVGSCPSE